VDDKTDNPWLAIPAADYEGHMGASGVDQLGPLRTIFAEAYARLRPERLAVLGCGPGNALDVVDPARTRRFVGVDLNAGYVALAQRRHAQLAAVAEWICADVATCSLDSVGFDLIHAALLFEYVDPAAVLPRIAAWLAPQGALSVVLQLPGGDAPISDTGFASLGALSGVMAVVPPDRFRDLAARAGLAETSSRRVPLARGKSFLAATFAVRRR